MPSTPTLTTHHFIPPILPIHPTTVSEALHTYIIKHFDEVWEQSKQLYAKEAKEEAKKKSKA